MALKTYLSYGILDGYLRSRRDMGSAIFLSRRAVMMGNCATDGAQDGHIWIVLAANTQALYQQAPPDHDAFAGMPRTLLAQFLLPLAFLFVGIMTIRFGEKVIPLWLLIVNCPVRFLGKQTLPCARPALPFLIKFAKIVSGNCQLYRVVDRSWLQRHQLLKMFH